LAAETSVAGTLREEAFHRMIALERRRLSRSNRTVVLMLVDIGKFSIYRTPAGLQNLLATLAKVTRETDVTGWYKENNTLGVMLTDVDLDQNNAMSSMITRRVSDALDKEISPEHEAQLSISFHSIAGRAEADAELKRGPRSVESPIVPPRPSRSGRNWAL
jgi:hypothetical protein